MEENTNKIEMLRQTAYELYKTEWQRRISTEDKLNNIRTFLNDTISYDDEFDDNDYADISYENFLFESGYNGSIYVCYDEFLDCEYQDGAFMRELLGSDVLFRYYKNNDPEFAMNNDDVSHKVKAMRHAAYELYKIEWHRNIGVGEELWSIGEYIDSLKELENVQTDDMYSTSNYADYLLEHGYTGIPKDAKPPKKFLSYSEFLRTHYTNGKYMRSLLSSDERYRFFEDNDHLFASEKS